MLHKFFDVRRFRIFVLSQLLILTSLSGLLNQASIASANAEQPVVVTLAQNYRVVEPGFFGYNTALTLSNLTWSPETGNNAAAYCPGMLRFPGGTISDYWDWRIGGVRPSDPGTFAKVVSAPRVWLAEFLQNGIGRTGAKPIFVLNMLTASVDDQIDMLAKYRELGGALDYAELGNEYYFSPFSYRFKNGKVYANEAEHWAQQIKARFPHIKLGVVTSTTDWGAGNWNEAAAMNVPDADAIIQHIYTPTGIGTAKVTAANIDTYLSAPVIAIQSTMSSADALAESSRKDIWVTEFNCYDWASNGGNEERQSWAHGLYVAEMAEQIGADKHVTHMLVHQLTSSTPSGAAFLSTTNQPTATGLAMQWFAWAASGAQVAYPLVFSSNPTLVSHSSLVGTLFRGTNGQNAYLMNLSPRQIKVDATPIWPRGCKYRQRYSAIDTDVTGSNSVSEISGNMPGRLTLPPYSITLLSDK